jgi:CRP/FNR family transcriptional regulator
LPRGRRPGVAAGDALRRPIATLIAGYHGGQETESDAMTPDTLKVACSSCNLRELCMPVGLQPDELRRIDEIVATRRKVKRRETLFRSGERFSSLYAIRTGVFKTR